jgi:hypothetical protein
MEREQKQPLDYETIEEFLDSGYKELNVLGKITFHLQDHLWKAIFIVLGGGYLAGTCFGVFW